MEDLSITRTGFVAGTPLYMSPEQALGEALDERSDLFSLGAVLYEMSTGRRAFQGETKLSTLSAILREEPKPVSELAPAIPRDLEKIIQRCLRKDPERRYQSMKDVKIALEELKEESDSGQLAAVPQAQRNSQRWVLAAAAAAAVTSDEIITLIYSLPGEFTQNARFVMNRATQGKIRLLKDGQNNYIWQPNFQNGQPSTLLSYGVVEAEDMPAIGANTLAVLFGDLKEYRLYDLVGMTMLRDPYSYDAYIALKTMKRFGGTLGNSEAVKVLKIATA